jgi:peptidoglycan-associated lipoprotein
MKTNSLVYALLVGLTAVSLATTGCKHKPMGVTSLPGQTAPSGTSTGNEDGHSHGPLIGAEGIPVVNPDGTIPAGTNIDIGNYNQDPTAFAADTVYFPYDSSAIKSTEQSKVEAVANALKSASANALQIQGHCDERGTEEYNRALGERRAEALREALAKLGVNPDHVLTISFGKDKPADPAHNEKAWSKNRRGEFILLTPKAGAGM